MKMCKNRTAAVGARINRSPGSTDDDAEQKPKPTLPWKKEGDDRRPLRWSDPPSLEGERKSPAFPQQIVPSAVDSGGSGDKPKIINTSLATNRFLALARSYTRVSSRHIALYTANTRLQATTAARTRLTQTKKNTHQALEINCNSFLLKLHNTQQHLEL